MSQLSEEHGATPSARQPSDYGESNSHRADTPKAESNSHEANALRAGLLLSLILLIVAAGACYGGVLLVKSGSDSYFGPSAFIVAAFLLISAGAVPAVMFWERGIQEDENREREEDYKTLEHALEAIHNRTLSGLAKGNFRQMRMFTDIALRQARMSYYASLVAASVSLLVLVSGGIVTVSLTGTSAKVAAGSVTAVGVALSGFLSATFINTYWMAVRQMSYYYGQPLAHCYLLHAEWLTLMFTEHPEWRADAGLWKHVVNAATQASEKAQDHLLRMQEAPNSWPRWRGRMDGPNMTGSEPKQPKTEDQDT